MTHEKLMLELDSFLDAFKAVFDDDWEFSKICLNDENQAMYLNGGTFLHPNVSDESNNWGNRGSLLAAYRKLKAATDACRGAFAPGETVSIVGIKHDGRIEYVKWKAHLDAPIYGVSYWWNGSVCNVELYPEEIAEKEDR